MVRAVMTLAALSFLVGCGGADKLSGVRAVGVKTLTVANANEGSDDLQPWVDEVRALSKGRLRIRVLSRWREGEADFESGLIADVRSGRVQLGWVGARAWTAKGVHRFDALSAPFQIDSYAAEAAMLRNDDRERWVAGLGAAGFAPVGLVPGPLHLLLARRPVARAADLQGLTIGVTASDVGQHALRVLGAVPVPLPRGASIRGLDAVVARLGDLASHLGEARYLTADAPLWSAPRVIFANRSTWDALSGAERTILRRAAAQASTRMFRNLEADDRAAMTQLCDGGVRLVMVGTRGREALRRAVKPAYGELQRSADARAGLEAVERARGSGETPQPLACTPPSDSPGLALTGAFEWTLRRGERGAGDVDFEGGPYLRYRLELRNGRAVQTVAFPDGHSEPGFDEKYQVYRDRITFGGDHGPPDTARWRLDGERLNFSELSQQDPAGHFVLESHTWIRVDR
jgi:TRAP-type transport system periplasmic protein